MSKNNQYNIILKAHDEASKVVLKFSKSVDKLSKKLKTSSKTSYGKSLAKGYEKASLSIKKAGKTFSTFYTKHQQKINEMSKSAMKWGAGMTTALALGIYKVAQSGQSLERIRTTFSSLTKVIGSSSEAIIELEKSTEGLVTRSDLMASSNKMLSMGLADSTEKLNKLSKMAVVLGSAMGKEATGALEDFSLMLANQSILRLDTFGISSGRVRAKMELLMKTTAGLTREQAFLNTTMEEAEKSMRNLGQRVPTMGEKMTKLQVKFKNMYNDVSEKMIPIMVDLGNTILPVVEVISNLIKEHPKLTANIIKTVLAVGSIITALASAIFSIKSIIFVTGVWRKAL
jgi:hypothetical protein